MATRSSSSKGASRKSRDLPVRQRAKRLPAEERRSLILKEAGVFFSEHGFAASTRDLADRLGVRQALLYKYFESKEALIETVFKEAFSDHWATKWAQVVADKSATLAERLATFYSLYADTADSLRLRLFLRGALDGYPLPAKLAPLLTTSLVNPLIAELRGEENLPDLSVRPLMAGERELVMLLHGAMVFYFIREHIYKAPVVADHGVVANLYIDSSLRGMRASLKSLHEGKGPAVLTAS